MTWKCLRAKVAATACAWIGHSNIVTGCFGYISCARCGAQIGDTLGGIYQNSRAAIVGHNCATCRTNYARMGWRDRFMAPNPIEEKHT